VSGCIVILDHFGDAHAHEAPEPCTPEALRASALELAEALGFDAGQG
jgi:hypothetical protein